MSPYWDKEFEDAVSAGAIEQPPEHVSLGGSWSSISDTGEATNLNLVSLYKWQCGGRRVSMM